MTSPEVEKGVGLREASAEKPPETPESERLPGISEIQRELDTETQAGFEAGHDTLQALGGKEQKGTEFPPELKEQFAEISKEAADKLHRLDASLGRMKKRFLSVANFLTGGLFEREQCRPKYKNKFFTGFYRDRNGKGIMEKERGKLESRVNMEQIRERARNADEYLSEKIRNSDVVLLGEIHTHETVEKRAVAGFLEQAKAAGTTHVGLEIPAYYQEAVDRFMATGKFDDADDPADYEQVEEYHRLFREQLGEGFHPKKDAGISETRIDKTTGKYEVLKPKGMSDEMFTFERKMRKNYLFKNHFDKDFRLLQGIRESGLTPVCLDANATYGASEELDNGLEAIGRSDLTMDQLKAREQELEEQRDIFMKQKIQGAVEGGGKMLAVLGNAHVARNGMEGRQNVADLLGETGIKTSSINLDRDCDSDAELSYYRREPKQSPDTSANAVLFSTIGKDESLADKSIGFDIDKSITGEKTAPPYDGYIRLQSSL